MNSVADAINTLISAVNVAHNKGGVYSMEETHYIYMAIDYLNKISQQEAPTQAPEQQSTPQTEAPAVDSNEIVEEVVGSNPQQNY